MSAPAKAIAERPRSGPGSKPRVDVEARRELFLRTASRLFLERGLNGTTMQDVAGAIGLPKPAVYRIFPSKQLLLDAILARVVGVIHEVYQEPNYVYGSRVASIARAAQACPEPFLLVLKYSKAGAELPEWAAAIDETFAAYTRDRWFRPGPNAPEGAPRRAEYASHLNVGPIVDTLIRWIENQDGLDEAARLRWWGRISREYHLASREAFRLGETRFVYPVAEKP